jgi:lipopolysaccharide/colanic/teichoic acid biosynthesis glycosyltransferase
MTLPKRLFDLLLAALIGFLFAPAMLAIALAIRVFDGAPIFYGAERIGQGGRPFLIRKFRTMASGSDDGVASGGPKARRITRTGRFLRRARLDELPQLWNILRGEMSFVGPRPPLRRYAERFPALYAHVLKARPGITGLATLYFHRREEAMLAPCATAEETDRVYSRRCVPMKARLDLLYLRRRSLALDIAILAGTALRLLPRVRRAPLGAGKPARLPMAG